jgi:hypothetical protein
MTSQVLIEDFYPYSYTPESRYGHGRPAHAQIEAVLARSHARYAEILGAFADLTPDFLKIPAQESGALPDQPYWCNQWLPGLDAATLYGFIAAFKPRIYCEVGSGHSTRFAAEARRVHSPQTHIISIDPAPRAEIAGLADTRVPKPLQECDPAMFALLEADDIFFLDGSHRVLQNSDVSVFFLEVLQVLKPGVVIHIHDIFWPADYPPHWQRRMYSEQYMLGLLLLYGMDRFEILMPNAYVCKQPDLRGLLDPLWTAPSVQGIAASGGSFWMRKRA